MELLEEIVRTYYRLKTSGIGSRMVPKSGDFVHNPAPEGMESLSSVTGRLGEFMEEIREKAEVENILISTHAIAMKGALEYLTPSSGGSYWSKYIGNCAVYAASVKSGVYDEPREVWCEAPVRKGEPE